MSYLKSKPWNCLIAKFWEKAKMPKFGSKNVLFRYFWVRISKSCCYNWNQHPRTCLIAKFCGKMKMPKFGTKNALFGYFWTVIWKQYFHIWNQHPRTSMIVKVWEKAKMPKFDTKNAYLNAYLKRILSYLKSVPSNLLYNSKILRKKCLNLEPKISYLGIFGL